MPAALLDALRAGHNDRALARFRVLATAPRPDAWLGTTWAAMCHREPVEHFHRDLADARSDPTAMQSLFARCVFGAGFAEVAVAAGRDAARRAPDDAEANLSLCALLLARRDPAANDVLRHCLDRFSKPARGYAMLGFALLDGGKPEAALVCLGRSPQNAAIATQRGLIARDLGRTEAAHAAFSDAVARDPGAIRAWFLLGHCAQERRDLVGAAAAYEAVLARDPTVVEAAVNLGTVRQESGDLYGAKAAYRLAVRTRGDTLGRVAQALSVAPCGELWLDLGALRHDLAG